jgi:hypothetical protein
MTEKLTRDLIEAARVIADAKGATGPTSSTTGTARRVSHDGRGDLGSASASSTVALVSCSVIPITTAVLVGGHQMQVAIDGDAAA